MPLRKNTYQPFFPDPNSPNPIACNGEYCYPVAAGDIPKQQWYQTPCSGNLVSDALFEDLTLGPELITNGNFDTNADDWFAEFLGPPVEIGSTTCPANVFEWCYNTGKLGHDGTGGGDIAVYQTGLGLSAGNIYRVVYTVQGRTQGAIYSQLGDSVGATQGALQQTNGTFTEFLFYNDTDDVIQFFPTADFDGNIDSISVKLVTMADWVGDFWVFDNESACIPVANASAGILYNAVADYVTSGDFYKIVVDVNITAGSLVVLIDDGTGAVQTNNQSPITATGTYTYYVTASQDGVIGFNPSADFVGCIISATHDDGNGNPITSPSIQRLRNDFVFSLINAAGDAIDISSYATYTNQYIDLNIDFSTLLESGTIDYGCFTIYAYDACLISGDNLLTDGDFDNQDYTVWTRNMNAYQYNFDGNGVEFILEPLEGPNLVSNSDFAAGPTDWTGFAGGDWVIDSGGARHIPGNTTPLIQPITLAAPIPPPNSLFTWHEITITNRTAGGVTINIGGTNSSTYIFNDQMANLMILTVGGAQNITITPTSNFDGTIDNIKVHQTANAWNNLPQLAHTPIPELIAANYNVDFTITSNIQDGTTGLYVQMDYNNPAQQGLVTGANSTTFMGYVPTMQMVRLSGQFRHVGGYYKLGRVAIDDVSVYQVEPFEATYQSECFNFKETHLNTKLITAYCDQNALGATALDAMGFASTGYVLQMRVECRSYNADLDMEVNVAKFGNGNASVKYGQFEKYWQFVTNHMSESALMTLGIMAHCDHFLIGETGTASDTEYIATVERFTPAWDETGSYDLATARITIRKKTGGMVFNRHN